MKKCIKCGKSDNEFVKDRGICVPCKREACRAYYYSHKEEQFRRNARHRAEKREKWGAYKSYLSCERCGYNQCWQALDFHHVNGNDKEYTVGQMMGHGCSWEKVLLELSKCVTLCANCHREHHAGLF